MLTGRRLLGVLATAVSVAISAPAAHAATVALEGSTWTYRGDGTEANAVIVSFDESAGRLLFQDQVAIGYGSPCVEENGFVSCPYAAGQSLTLVGGAGDDALSLSDPPADLPAALDGGDGNDTLQDAFEASALRTFVGGAGNDEVAARGGPDHVSGGTGDDKLSGGAGPDQLRGEDGNDTLAGDAYESPSPDLLDGGAGVDSLTEWSQPTGANPPVSVTQDGAADDGRPGEGDNVISVEKITAHSAGRYAGTSASDEIWVWANTGRGASTVAGLGGDDRLTGEDEPETMDGGPGNDRLQGGFGDDVLTGGPGRDTILGDGGGMCDLYSCAVPAGNDRIEARDGETDSIDCGPGTDTAVVDPTDTVAHCETVDAGVTPKPDPRPDRTTTAAVSLRGKASIRTLLRRRLRFQTTCAGACRVAGRVVLRGRTMAIGRRTLIKAGRAMVTLRPTKEGRRRLRRTRKARMVLTGTVSNADGRQRRFRRTITFRR